MGILSLNEKCLSPAGFAVSSNAATSVGCSALLGKSWFALRWPKIENLPEIATLEFVPMVLVTSVSGKL